MAYPCVNEGLFGPKIVNMVDMHGFHDTLNRDAYFLQQIKQHLLGQPHFIPQIAAIFIVLDASSPRNSIFNAERFLQEALGLGESQAAETRQSSVVVVNKLSKAPHQSKARSFYSQLLGSLGYAHAVFETKDYCLPGDTEREQGPQLDALRARLATTKPWKLV